ncbi:E3 SUMO-protein ligase PIAS2-like [Argiope bruennichi]|uniref:E3 SUMO-protein ligase PIAS2-like n=1 Tax=Argiope bruennichi TaxID=94029 RepID=UPI002494B332|nr:E3 SUMO-protein ligase PIAS2-like [Argiope bruennichi]
MADAELRNMIMNFRVSDLQVLLGFAGRNKTGKKQELQARALDLLKLNSPAVNMKVRELHNRRYHHQLMRPNSYEMAERPLSEAPMNPYDLHMNNNYAPRCNPNVRPTPVHQGPSSSYSSSGKSYVASHPNTNTQPHYSTYSDVKFKELPFYDIMYVLVRPTSLVADPSERYQETSFYFTLTPQQAQDVAISKNASGNYECQILLRFCLLDVSSEQEDNFPPSICVKVNSKIVTLPNPIPTNRPGVEPKRPSRPVNITSFSKLSPTVTNVVTVSWASTYGRSYVAALYIVRQLSSQTLLQRLKDNGVRNPEYTTAMIKEKLQQGQDAEIATTSLRGSLICPLGKVKMELPCRAVTCTHLQCFDASLYIQMNEKKPKWICPVCDKPALFRTLAIDGLFIEIASKVPSECTEVQFNEDGSWTPIIPVKEPKEAKKTIEKRPKKNSKPVEVVDISDSDSEEVWSYDIDPQAVKTGNSPDLPPLPLSPNSLLFPTSLANSESYPVSLTQSSNPFPESLSMPSDVQNETSEPVCVLPDLLLTHNDTSMPSTSSSSPGLNSTSFPNMPFLNDGPFYSAATNRFSDQLGSVNGNQSAVPPSFDFLSLIQGSDVEPQKNKEYDSKESGSSPDVISLD